METKKMTEFKLEDSHDTIEEWLDVMVKLQNSIWSLIGDGKLSKDGYYVDYLYTEDDNNEVIAHVMKALRTIDYPTVVEKGGKYFCHHCYNSIGNKKTVDQLPQQAFCCRCGKELNWGN